MQVGGCAESTKRMYPDPGFGIERPGGVARGTYTVRTILRAVEYTRVLRADGKPVGNTEAARVLRVDKSASSAGFRRRKN